MASQSFHAGAEAAVLTAKDFLLTWPPIEKRRKRRSNDVKHLKATGTKKEIMVSQSSDASVEASSMAEEFPTWPTEMKRKRSNRHLGSAEIITKRRRINGSGLIWRIARKAGGGTWKLSVHKSAEAAVKEEEEENEKEKKKKEEGEKKKKSQKKLLGSRRIMARGNPKKRLQCGGGFLSLKLVEMGVDQDGPVCPLRKAITRSDIDVGQHRLLLPKNLLDERLLQNMMTPAEKTRTREKSGLAVRTLDRAGREYNLVLKFVDSLKSYRIIGPDYTKLVEQNGFQVGHFLDLWLFRAQMAAMSSDAADELWMAVEVDDENAGDGKGSEAVQLDLGGDIVERRWRLRAAAGGRGREEMELEMESSDDALLGIKLSSGEEEMKAALVTPCHGDVEEAALALVALQWAAF